MQRRFPDDAALWAALAESPYDDVRAFLVGALARERRSSREPAPRLGHALLAMHRGGRAKRACWRRSPSASCAPGRAESLLPLLASPCAACGRASALAGAAARAACRQPALAAAARGSAGAADLGEVSA